MPNQYHLQTGVEQRCKTAVPVLINLLSPYVSAMDVAPRAGDTLLAVLSIKAVLYRTHHVERRVSVGVCMGVCKGVHV